MNRVGRKLRKIFGPVLLALVLTASSGLAAEVVLPLTLDYTLLSSLLQYHGFSGDDHSAAIVGTPGDCTYVRGAEPAFSAAGKLLRLEMRLDIQVGLQVGESCVAPVAWQGYIELLQQPIFDSQSFSLSFRTVDSNLLTLTRKPAAIAGVLWDFAKPRVYEHLDRVQLDLAPPVSELRSFLIPLFHADAQQASRAMLDSLHGGRVDVAEEGMVLELLAEVEEVFAPEDGVSPALTADERQQLVQLWETWDALLVQLLVTLESDSLRPEERQILVDVLLDTRYLFSTTLELQGLGKDFVRLQFVRAWRRLAPVFRRQLYVRPSENSLGYLTFFTAADALAVFDRMGPTFGIELSQQGLLRLAAMLNGRNTALPYTPKVDRQLRQLLQLPLTDAAVTPLDDLEEIDFPQKEPDVRPLSRAVDFFCRPAYGAELPTYAEILRWKVPKENLAGYMKKINVVLADSVDAVLSQGNIPKQFHGMFKKLIPAMAWQESCFRQFVVKNNKLTYLLSYNQTSVGLMQINERVWRGIYDRSRLRWDIHYNGLAGCEIADLYLRKYALKDPIWQKGGDLRLLSQVVYAIYNGGPGQYKKFLARSRTGKLYTSDQLFLEKLQWVSKGNWACIEKCLVGG